MPLESPPGEPMEYVLVVRPLPHDVPPVIRLRRCLKVMLRTHGLRAVSVSIRGAHTDSPDGLPRTAGRKAAGGAVRDPGTPQN